MAFLRALLTIGGGFLVVAGCFFALQGAGIIMWPPESFMLASRTWVTYGIIIALAGAAVLLLGRRLR
ncbi:MAG: hypothetical protein IE933_02180 [Sphingomonadales bacterium]|nr:hypothetical protein [Sphingomonadales bacterium]MBD3772221.1 hypothetical protein [Paracoccaceae bacterium]